MSSPTSKQGYREMGKSLLSFTLFHCCWLIPTWTHGLGLGKEKKKKKKGIGLEIEWGKRER
jgi:hypothetical protein